MATAAFKSSSRRGNASSENSNSYNKIPPERRRRRSLSVSAVSRNELDVPSEFSNKRENPLFWSTRSPPEEEIEPENAGGLSKLAENASKSSGALTSKDVSAGERGRSVARNSDVGSKREIGRSLSRVDTSRRVRSVSRGHGYGSSEGEGERGSIIPSNNRKIGDSNQASNNVKKVISVRKVADTRDRTGSLRSQSNRHLATEASGDSAVSSSNLQVPNVEDGISTGSLSEAEEKTIKAVSEQMKSLWGDHSSGSNVATSGIYETVRSEVRRAISDIHDDIESVFRRNNSTAIAPAEVTDIPTDLVNPGAVELVLDIRREYARKHEESQERARKLRADLAIEEHREQELSRILKETLPDPKTSIVRRSRPGRRTSSERKKMSKRLTEEAMTYFDECLSISTFDSSDFSAAEDQPLNSVGATVTVGCTASLTQESTRISASRGPTSCLNRKQESLGVSHGPLMHCHEDSCLTANSSSNEQTIDQASQRVNNREKGRKSQFSFGQKPTEDFGLRKDIRSSYIIDFFEKEVDEDGIKSEIVKRSYYDRDGYDLHGRAETLLFDKVFFKNRIESGRLHLCGGGIGFSFTPFASII